MTKITIIVNQKPYHIEQSTLAPEGFLPPIGPIALGAAGVIAAAALGALTFAIVEAIRKSKGRLTYRELHDRTSAVLKTRKFDQVPQLEGRTSRFDRPLFAE